MKLPAAVAAGPAQTRPRLLRRLLFQQPARDRSCSGIVLWWESRRLLFNALVGATGLLTLIVLGTLTVVLPRAPFYIEWRIVGLYAVIANAMYTAGWAVELWLRWFLGTDHPVVGPALFRYGLIASLGLTLFPVPFALLVTLNRWLGQPIPGW